MLHSMPCGCVDTWIDDIMTQFSYDLQPRNSMEAWVAYRTAFQLPATPDHAVLTVQMPQNHLDCWGLQNFELCLQQPVSQTWSNAANRRKTCLLAKVGSLLLYVCMTGVKSRTAVAAVLLLLPQQLAVCDPTYPC